MVRQDAGVHRIRSAVAFARDVQRRYGELGGAPLASALTLSAFLSLIPLVVVGIAIVGFVAAGSPDLGERLVEGLGLTGAAAELFTDAIDQATSSRRAASVVGLASFAFTGLGLARNLQQLHCRAWQVERRGLRTWLFASAWLLVAGLLFVGAFALSGVLAVLPPEVAVGATAASLLLNLAVLLSTQVLVPNDAVGWRDLLPVAVAGAVVLEVLKLVGAVWVPRAITATSGVYGPLGVVIAVIGWLLVFGRVVVVLTMAQVLRWERRHGTSLRRVAVPGPVDLSTDLTRGGLVAAPRGTAPLDRLAARRRRAG